MPRRQCQTSTKVIIIGSVPILQGMRTRMELILQHLSGLRRKSKLVHRQPNHCDEQVIILYVLPKHGPPVTNKVNIETFIIPTATGLRVHTSEEAETTPHQRDVQALPVDSDGDLGLIKRQSYCRNRKKDQHLHQSAIRRLKCWKLRRSDKGREEREDSWEETA